MQWLAPTAVLPRDFLFRSGEDVGIRNSGVADCAGSGALISQRREIIRIVDEKTVVCSAGGVKAGNGSMSKVLGKNAGIRMIFGAYKGRRNKTPSFTCSGVGKSGEGNSQHARIRKELNTRYGCTL